MDFDFSQIAIPFRMQPGLRRLAPESLSLTPLDPQGPLYAEKQAVVAAGQARQLRPGFDPTPALQAIADRAARQNLPTGLPPELQFEEDLAVLDGADGTLPWLAVCVPSHWAPEDKCGLHFAALHAPVADNSALIAATEPLLRLVTGGDCFERFVWTITPSARHDQHPRLHARTPWPDMADEAEFACACHLRVERQAFFPVLRGTRQAVFSIRVMLQPLAEAARVPGAAARMRDSLASMSDAVLDYKGLTPARDRLVGWLGSRAAP